MYYQCGYVQEKEKLFYYFGFLDDFLPLWSLYVLPVA